jgi:hypothetical protein
VTDLRLVESSWIEFEGHRIARLEPKLSPSLIDRLKQAFDAAEESGRVIAELENQIERLEERLATGRRPT